MARRRVVVVGLPERGRSWLPQRAGEDVDVSEAASIAEMPDGDVDLIVMAGSPDSAREAVADLEARRGSSPAVMLWGGGDRHPHFELLEILLAAKLQWETAFDALVDPVAVLDATGRVFRANLALARVSGREVRALIGVHYKELFGEPEAGAPDMVALSLEDGEARTAEQTLGRVQGVQLMTVGPIGGAGEVRGLVVILKDVTELREQRERLLQASRLADIGQLAAGVAHEINTPLASIALRAESLLRSAKDPRFEGIDSFKNFPRYLKTIEEEIFRCKKIIGALLEFSRPRAPEMRPTDLNAVARKAADLVGHQMRLKQVALALELAPELPAVPGDEGRLLQVTVALLMNALDAARAGGRVAIHTSSRDDGHLGLAVQDDGVGIAAEHLPRLFSPFFTTKPPGKGTGLGLAIVHSIVTAHGGQLEVDSEPGRGTRMTVAIPMVGTPGAASA